MNTQRISKIFTDARLTLYALETVNIWQNKTSAGGGWYGNIQPVAIIVRSLDNDYALGMEDHAVALEELRQGYPELDALLSSRHTTS